MKICIAHFRVGLTDGVSLQIDERARILERFGHKVYFIGDLNSPTADLKIPYFNYLTNLKVQEIQQAAFSGHFDKDHRELLKEVSYLIENQIEEFWDHHHFTLIFIHNIFSLPVCLPATIAFYNFLKRHPQIKAVGVHHDFWWDPPRRQKFKTASSYIKKIRKFYFPPKLPNLSHTVLSLWEKRKLIKKREIESKVITDTFDFDQKPWVVNKSNEDFLKDMGLKGNELILLLASRIRPRKGIELGIEFASNLSKKVKNKEVVLLLPNDFSEKDLRYVKLLKAEAKDLGVNVHWIQNLVGSEEEKQAGIKKYSLWDTYVYADVVLYPSIWEGFGNQFLEAVFAKKPIVTFEYPVFGTDIKPAGFKVIRMPKVIKKDPGGLVEIKFTSFKRATTQLLRWLDNKKKLNLIVDKNFKIGKRRFNTRLQLRDYLSGSSFKYVRTNGYRTVISPLLLSGKLIASGVRIGEAYDFAESIVSEVSDKGITNEDFFAHVVKRLSKKHKRRFVTYELVREFLTSKKSKSPLFIFLGGLAGKTSLSNLVVNHIGISQPVAFDNEKYHIANPQTSESFLWKATYESAEGYIKTVEVMYPYLLKMIDRLLFDYKRYKKWCYFWEGIYLSSEVVKKLKETHPGVYYLSVFVMPKFSDIRRQYILRWQEELGIERLKKKRNVIDGYLSNVSAIRSHIKKNLDPIASFVIESPVLEERLDAFYAILYQCLKDIANKEVPGWIEKVVEKPEQIKQYKKFLREP